MDTKVEWQVKKQFTCACGVRYSIVADAYSLLFEVECAIQQSCMMIHKAVYCRLLTVRLGDRT